jgi:hypothetical protein
VKGIPQNILKYFLFFVTFVLFVVNNSLIEFYASLKLSAPEPPEGGEGGVRGELVAYLPRCVLRMG